MRGIYAMMSALFNVMIIVFVIRLVASAARKRIKPDEEERKTYPDRPRKTQTRTFKSSYTAKDLKHETTESDKRLLNLKRCPNCGGEIPLTMMKCEICGHRQPGCGLYAVIFFIFVAIAIALVFLRWNGISWEEFLHQLFNG